MALRADGREHGVLDLLEIGLRRRPSRDGLSIGIEALAIARSAGGQQGKCRREQQEPPRVH
jgi:hypothetical protein